MFTEIIHPNCSKVVSRNMFYNLARGHHSIEATPCESEIQ